jgi:UDP-glucose 4-epimerase
VLKACIQNKIRKIIFAPSAFVYGDCNKLPITEKSDTSHTSPYGSSYQLRMK